MLTLKQLFAASGFNSGAALVQNLGLQPLSVSSVISAYSQQRQAYFVKLISPGILLSDEVRSFDDLTRLSEGPQGQMTQAQVTALAAYLENHGVFLRYVSKDLRRAVIFGDVPSLVNVPAAPINDGNFISIKDTSAGATKVGVGTIAAGTVLVTVAGSPAVGAAGETMLVVGALAVVFAAGFLIGWGIMEIRQGDTPPPPPKPSSDNIDLPNTIDGNDSGDVEIPNALATGTPDNGINVQGMVDQLATGTLDDIISTFPIGWDSGSGTPLPGIGDFGGGGGGDEGSLGSDFGFG